MFITDVGGSVVVSEAGDVKNMWVIDEFGGGVRYDIIFMIRTASGGER